MSSAVHRFRAGRTRRAFTLVETMVVVVLVGILAPLALPLYQKIEAKANETQFMNEQPVATRSIERYAMEKGEWPPDGAGGRPSEMEEFLPPTDRWNLPTPIGGQWRWSREDGFEASWRVIGLERGLGHVTEIDRLLDNGDWPHGVFRSDATQLVYVLQK
jgi:prepilin-type N-terminal cleavage/methylation domain-containing protein